MTKSVIESYSIPGDMDQLGTPQNTATPSLISMASPTHGSPSCSLPNASSVPNLPAVASVSNSGTTTPKATPPPPAIHLSTPKDTLSVKKKNSLTSSLTNMMVQLDNSIRGTATTPTSENEAESEAVKSDDSDADSESFVVINQAVLPDDVTRDTALFAINSKRASPVEVATEAFEEANDALTSFDIKVDVTAPPSEPVSLTGVPQETPPPREGVVSGGLR